MAVAVSRAALNVNVRIDPAATPYFHQGVAGGVGVVLIHGLTASPTEVRPLAAYLERHEPNLTLSCPLLPGHGTTPEHLRRTGPGEWTAAVAAEVDRLATRCRSMAVIGVSMGAALAAQAAIADQRIRSVTLLAPILGLARGRSLMMPILRYVVRFRKKSRRSLENHRIKGLYSYDCYPIDSLMHLRTLAAKIHAELGKLVVPTLIAGGRHDPYVPWSRIEALPHQLGTEDIEIVECPSSGHILPHEPDAPHLVRRIHQFLRRAHGLD